jgi:hypothetical protein
MDDVQKSRIRMLHWIEHNIDHVSGYKEVAAVLEKAGYSQAADRIRKGIDSIKEANEHFEAAIIDLPDSAEEHGHSHSHDHGHTHSHSHSHKHDHEHEK